MPKHIAVTLMSAHDYKRGTRFDRFKPLKGRQTLKDVYKALVEYHTLTSSLAGKAQVQKRWDLMLQIAGGCVEYAGTDALSPQESRRVQTVKALRDQAMQRQAMEVQRASDLSHRLGAKPGGRGINIGVRSHDKDIRFERLNKPGGGAIYGNELVDLAADQYGIELTGNADVDYYTMKKVLKNVQSQHANRFFVVYMNEMQRERFRLDISSTPPPGRCTYGTKFINRPFDTDAEYYLYAMDANGTIFSAPENTTTPGLREGKLHHSSFLSGETAICAGTVKAKNGRIYEISNNSGHYAPSIENFVDACQVILDIGYQPKDDCYALFMDLDRRAPMYPKENGAILRVPLDVFVDYEGRPIRYQDFLCDYKMIPGTDKWYYPYSNPHNAETRGCTFDYY